MLDIIVAQVGSGFLFIRFDIQECARVARIPGYLDLLRAGG